MYRGLGTLALLHSSGALPFTAQSPNHLRLLLAGGSDASAAGGRSGRILRCHTTALHEMASRGKSTATRLTASSSGSDTLEMPKWFKPERVRCLTDANTPRNHGDCVVYWMNRDQRAEENWAMLYARHLAEQGGVPLVVAFVLGAWRVPEPKTTLRYAGFMMKGLAETEADLRKKHIPFYLLQAAEPVDVVPGFAKEHRALAVVTDMCPLRDPTRRATEVADELSKGGDGTPLFQVDAHNVVPVWTASDKQENMARTIRPKIHARPDFLGAFPELSSNAAGTKLPDPTDWENAQASLDLDRSVPEITWLKPGAKGASANLQLFLDKRIKGFAELSNDPNKDVCSHMSAYFNLGQMSAQGAVMRVKSSRRHPDGVKAFVEQGIVRRELSDNFCFYSENYDNLSGAAVWARDSLEAHANDQREWTYSLEELEKGKTHEDLWNAAQLQLVRDGKMHNFLRMYWAKKILEWSQSPHDALERCIFLNDKYELDGRDPNGFTGCAWSVMGIHDMGWKEREIFGKIRYMNYAGCKRKFDVQGFVSKYPGAAKAAAAAGGTVATAKRKPSGTKKGSGGSGGSGGRNSGKKAKMLGGRKS